MKTRLLLLAGLVLVLSAALTSLGSAAVKAKTLTGEVGPGFKIEVSMAGKDVKTLKAGTYKLHVEDKAAIHNFHLIGPGVNKVVTSVAFVGEKTVTVKLKKGKYTYQCDPHAAGGMKGSISVR